MKKLTSGLMAVVIAMFFSMPSQAAIGDLFVQVDLPGLSPDGCSIMKVTPAGVISEFISNAQILAVTGDTSADCDDTGLAVSKNGHVFFNEDGDDDILMATSTGALSIFVPESAIAAAIGLPDADIDNGMAINPVDGNLYVAEEDSDSILRIIIGGTNNGQVTQIITQAQLQAILPPGSSTVDLEGGIAIDFEGSIYISDDGNDLIFKWDAPAGVLRVLSTEAQIIAATGGTSADLDVGLVFGGDLFVLDDNCDCLLRIDSVKGTAFVLVSEASIIAATGNDFADVEGGIAIDENQNLYIGDDGDLGPDDDRPNIVLGRQDGTASLFVSTTQIRGLYDVLEPGGDPRLVGSMAIEGMFDFPPTTQSVPTLSEWGLILMAAILGIVGFMVARRRMVRT